MAVRSTRRAGRFGASPFLIGVVHLLPLPGSPRARSLSATIAAAERDARVLLAAGYDGLLVENFGDVPFHAGRVEPVTIAAIAVVAARIKALAGPRPVGVNVLRNDAAAALGVAVAAGLQFLRVNVLTGPAVTDQGILEGDAAGLLRARAGLGSDVAIFADVAVKHATPLRTDPLAIQVDELLHRALADAILVTGAATGTAPDRDVLSQVRAAAGSALVIVASGTTVENVADLSADADGFIVGTAIKRGGITSNPVDAARASRLAAAVKRLQRSARPPR